MLDLAHLRTALASPFMPVVFFFAGVTYDTITLTRIDRLLDNLILLLYSSFRLDRRSRRNSLATKKATRTPKNTAVVVKEALCT